MSVDSGGLDLKPYMQATDRLFTDIVHKLDKFADNVDRRLDVIQEDGKRAGERLARIETQLQSTGEDMHELRADLKVAKAEIRTSDEKREQMERRVTRLETMIVPAAVIVTGAVSAFAAHFLK